MTETLTPVGCKLATKPKRSRKDHGPRVDGQGRPLNLTSEIAERVIAHAASGMDFVDCCVAAGVAKNTARRWHDKATKYEAAAYEDNMNAVPDLGRKYLNLLVGVQEQHARLEMRMLAQVQQSASDGNTDAAKWVLERVHGYTPPKRVRDRSNRNTGNPPGRPVGATSAPDRQGTEAAAAPPPRLRLAGGTG